MKDIAILIYILNATLLIVHEIESGYEKEWEILKLPGKLTGFLIMHIPLLILLFYGLIELYKETTFGIVVSIVSGFGGLLPFMVHKVFVKKEDRFNQPVSNIIIYLNIITGIATIIFTVLI